MLPALCNEFITLLKETSICGYIGLTDLTRGGDIIRSNTFDAFMPLILVAAIYLVIVQLLTMGVAKMERRLRKMSAETLLYVEGLTKTYGENVVLDNISTEIKRGEVVAIIGPSGCGKSTFLRSLNQLEKITSGSIYFDGVDMTGEQCKH